MLLVAGYGFGYGVSRGRIGFDLPFPQKIETVCVHHLVPGSHKVLHEGFLRIAAGIDLGDGAELRVRTEDEIDNGARST